MNNFSDQDFGVRRPVANALDRDFAAHIANLFFWSLSFLLNSTKHQAIKTGQL